MKTVTVGIMAVCKWFNLTLQCEDARTRDRTLAFTSVRKVF